jgi:hypothetical protein
MLGAGGFIAKIFIWDKAAETLLVISIALWALTIVLLLNSMPD